MKTAKKTVKKSTPKAHEHNSFCLSGDCPRQKAGAEVFALGFLMFAGVLLVFGMMISHY